MCSEGQSPFYLSHLAQMFLPPAAWVPWSRWHRLTPTCGVSDSPSRGLAVVSAPEGRAAPSAACLGRGQAATRSWLREPRAHAAGRILDSASAVKGALSPCMRLRDSSRDFVTSGPRWLKSREARGGPWTHSSRPGGPGRGVKCVLSHASWPSESAQVPSGSGFVANSQTGCGLISAARAVRTALGGGAPVRPNQSPRESG